MQAHIDAVLLFYLTLFLASAWGLAFTLIAAIVVRRRTWRILAVMAASMVVVLGALIVQRSPWSAAAVDQILVYVQRLALGAWTVAGLWLVYYLIGMENGRLAVVRDAMLLRPLWRRARLIFEPHGHPCGGKR
jgi:hypothetical protein